MNTKEGFKFPVDMIGLPPNFHKKHLPYELQRFCLGDKKLSVILQTIITNGDYQVGDTILIPFGGPGSISHFFDFQGVPTILGDIRYGNNKYRNPHGCLNKFRQKYPQSGGGGVEQNYALWDAISLPLKNESQKIAIVNPPFGVECDVEDDPIELALKALISLERVLVVGGVAYYVVPKLWTERFLAKMTDVTTRMFPQILHDSVLSSSGTKNPLNLIRIEKK